MALIKNTQNGNFAQNVIKHDDIQNRENKET